jgi:hypothetical protein
MLKTVLAVIVLLAATIYIGFVLAMPATAGPALMWAAAR